MFHIIHLLEILRNTRLGYWENINKFDYESQSINVYYIINLSFHNYSFNLRIFKMLHDKNEEEDN